MPKGWHAAAIFSCRQINNYLTISEKVTKTSVIRFQISINFTNNANGISYKLIVLDRNRKNQTKLWLLSSDVTILNSLKADENVKFQRMLQLRPNLPSHHLHEACLIAKSSQTDLWGVHTSDL